LTVRAPAILGQSTSVKNSNSKKILVSGIISITSHVMGPSAEEGRHGCAILPPCLQVIKQTGASELRAYVGLRQLSVTLLHNHSSRSRRSTASACGEPAENPLLPRCRSIFPSLLLC